MQDNLERLIKLVYKGWKSDHPKIEGQHPDEEALACFIEEKLTKEESENIKAHLISCESCAELVAVQARLIAGDEKEVPQELLARVKDLVIPEAKFSPLEIFLKLKAKALEIVNTTGDVLVGQELMPAPILRSRKIKDFKDEVIILKDFADMRVEAKVENKEGKAFSITILVKEKATQKIIKDLRITLIKDDLELESYIADSGKVIFENVLLGKYTVDISNIDNKIVSIILDIKT